MIPEKVDIQVLKKLRAITGAGIGECKTALLESRGDLDKAREFLSGLARIKAEKKSVRITPEGRFAIAINAEKNRACVLEVRCETDFVSRHESFQEAAASWAQKALNLKIADNVISLQSLQDILEEDRINLVQKTDENIRISDIFVVFGKMLSAYEHGDGKTCVIADLDVTSVEENDELLKKATTQLALGSGPNAWIASDSEKFSAYSKEGSMLIKPDNSSKEIWTAAPFFWNEKKTFGEWMKQEHINLRGYARFCLSLSQENLGQKFTDDVQALLSKYGKDS